MPSKNQSMSLDLNKPKVSVRVLDRAISDFGTTYAEQKCLVEKKKMDTSLPDYLIWVEHPDVYTCGRKVTLSEEELSVLKALAPVYQIERGGEVTFHTLGQLVCYPIFSLKKSEQSIPDFLRGLEESIMRMLLQFEVETFRKQNATGVWLMHQERERKIASIGISFSSWVSYHGAALNVSNDLSGFRWIKPCGFESGVMISMKEVLSLKTNRLPSMNEIKEAWLSQLLSIFHRTIVFCFIFGFVFVNC